MEFKWDYRGRWMALVQGLASLMRGFNRDQLFELRA